jgi:alpha-amylase
MVEALGAHPGVRLGLHYSGPLLEWLRAERPSFISDVRALVERGQVEILGGGLYEPVLAAIPERDRLGQLTRMADQVESTFGRRPTGAWLAERVWEPDLPTSIVDSGYGWTILDDSHFRAASIPDDAVWGPYSTDDQGRRMTLFGTDRGLRYLIPFHDVDEVIAYLQEHATDAGDRLATMGDDGEKFGAWPGTFEHCWGKAGWVEQFFAALESNASWLTTIRPSDWLAAHPPIGRAYVPTGSYAEMGEWALPAEEGRAFSAALKRAREGRSPEERWLRGSFWRNFQAKYREVNDLHKQMLRASAKVDAMAPGEDRDVALDHVYRGQSNDCYWHGLFGGIYIPHMRAATLGHLIAAENLADSASGTVERAALLDADLDGRDEVVLANAGQVIVIKPDEGAGIGSWDIRAARLPLASVLRRRPEAYHETLRANEAAAATARAAAEAPADDAPASIHEIVKVKEAGLAARLLYDDYERRSGLVRILPFDMTPGSWAAGGRDGVGDFVAGPFRIVRIEASSATFERDGIATVDGTTIPLRVVTTISLGGDRLRPELRYDVSVVNRGDQPLVARVGIEWALNLLGGGGNPAAWWDLAGKRTAHDASGSAEGVREIGQGNDWLGLSVRTAVDPAADAWSAPIETVSNSEDGFERVYQGSALLLSWPVELAPGTTFAIRIRHLVEVASSGSRGPEKPSARGLRATG